MRLVLVDNLHLEHTGEISSRIPQPQLGLISLISVARTAGYDARLYSPALDVLDGRLGIGPALYTEMAERILEFNPDAVGFTTLGCNFLVVVRVADELSLRRPTLPILLGGPHATVLAHEILARFPQFDVIVKHEAEATLVPVLDGLSNWRFGEIPGIAHRNGSQIIETAGQPIVNDLDTLPWPAYDIWPMDRLGSDYLRVEAGRGCPFSCTFCSTASFFGRNYRLKSPQRLRAELDHLNARYGVRRFSLQHDLFTVSRKKVAAFCEVMLGSEYEWACSARMDCVDRELLELMSAAGCRSIYFGVETASARLQNVLQKRLDLALFDPTLDDCQRLNIRPTVSFITGYPDETDADQQATLNCLGSTFHRRVPITRQLHLLTPEPGTKLLKEARERLRFDGHVSDFNFPPLEARDSETILENKTIFPNHHYFEGVLSRRKHVFASSIFIEYCRLGAPTMSLLIGFFDGSLAKMTNTLLDDWIDEGEPEIDLSFVIEAISRRLEHDSPVISLCRYHKQIWSLRQAALAAQRAPFRKGKAGTITLALGVGILRDIHDCPTILEELEAGRTLPVTPIVNLLLAITEPYGDRVQNFQIGDLLALLLEKIDSHVPLATLSDLVTGAGIDRAEFASVLENLVSAKLVYLHERPAGRLAERACA